MADRMLLDTTLPCIHSEGLSTVIRHALEAPTPSEGSMTEAQPVGGGDAVSAVSTRAAAAANTQAWVETHSLPSVPTTTITTTTAPVAAGATGGPVKHAQPQPSVVNGKSAGGSGATAAQGAPLHKQQNVLPRDLPQSQHYTNGTTGLGHTSVRAPSLAPSAGSLRLVGNHFMSGGGVPRPLVLGLDLPPDLVRRSMEGSVGWDGSYDGEQRVSECD
jgi:hypothetical protein